LDELKSQYFILALSNKYYVIGTTVACLLHCQEVPHREDKNRKQRIIFSLEKNSGCDY